MEASGWGDSTAPPHPPGFQKLRKVEAARESQEKFQEQLEWERTSLNVQSHKEALLWQAMGRWEGWKASGDMQG